MQGHCKSATMIVCFFASEGDVMTDIFVEDNLHLNAKGYEIWTAAVRSVLVESEAKYEGTD